MSLSCPSILTHCSFAESPIRSSGGSFCLQPESGNCNPADNTRLVYMKDSPECSKDYMVFTYYNDILTHKCSGKRVCPLGQYIISRFVCLFVCLFVKAFFEKTFCVSFSR